ncbi:RNA-binding protein (KH domain) [Chthonomonas calidirosea]|uniref:RNA-binding protein KhpA n=1 Tax=Chthonomonas calidirosea (strain DSM 23976 / ICMP 18418 / T49) TaxID=1303518 RepID=S0EY43_CHTCT|nr:KH domain-containing protein [Chthonomonas calidirosea]CCW36464.1 RNA-binding protein (KH domain) [Chthonomonas calidirosea T49]CEK16172.1 RNA-binding protein (KH domain) [Chthonomonas calidirosea]CEK16173.1 RNA-binding protein (KH domain) [Chthonomonas calidirosea]CEK17260.1 RNA-binding protein (KH domain) [Chthonomonas calidirosea]
MSSIAAESKSISGLLEYLIKSLVDDPESVTITEVERPDITVYEVRVAPGDLGRIIGKQGRVVNALRTVARAAARGERRVQVEVISDAS